MAASAVLSVVVQKNEKLLQIFEAPGTKVALGLSSSVKQQIIQQLKSMQNFLREEETKQMKQEDEDVSTILQVQRIAYELEDAVDISFLEELGRSNQAYSTLNRSGICILICAYIRRIVHSVDQVSHKSNG